MLQACAKEYGWTHKDMLSMSKRVLFRYYGYYLIDLIEKAEAQEKENAKYEREQRMNNPDTQWKNL
jgi:hypothetical protein